MDGNFNNMGMKGMGGGGGGERSGSGKKAVHVKWAGKTIALGTFPAAEADEKCARAKALTRAWRSTMRPKPSREWVMLELERLQVRIVSGRLGRKGDDDDDDDDGSDGSDGGGNNGGNLNNNNNMNNFMGGMGMMGNMGGMGNMGNNNDHRPFVGGGAAAAYEAARADHCNNNGNNNVGNMKPMNDMGGGGMGNLGLSVNPNQHYEMLKLHHMNLLNEIQETTLMMNLYQQQMLQQSGGNQAGNNIGGGGGNMGGGNMGMPNPGMNMGNMMGMSTQGQGVNRGGNFDTKGSSGSGKQHGKSDDERARMLRELKEDIARQEREANELEASLDPSKRKNDDDSQGEGKRVKRSDDDSIKNETSV